MGGASGYSLTINGTGTVSTTIIQQTDGHDRIFEEDFTFAGSNPLTIQNVTLQGGDCNTGTDCQFGGGAILAGGPDVGDNLTLTNVVVSSNSEPTNSDDGGAIDFETPGNLTITGSTLSNNTATGGGGAIEFVEGPNGAGTLSVTSSTFSNNTAVISGGGISATLETGAAFTISGSSFTSNHVTEGAGLGGGIFAETSGTVTASNSRFVGNSAPGGGTGAAIDASTAGTLTNNWWGCNGGPGASGCDTAQAGGGGTDTFNPWLVLSVSANPTQINPSGTSTLTADLTHNSNAVGGFSVPNGTAVTFGGTLDSSVNPTNTTLTSGQATSTYTAGSSAGNGTGTAAVDNQSVSTPINILVSVTVTTSPANLSITVDGVTSTAPQSFNWVVGSSHTIATTSPQNVSGGTEQVFSSWSDGGAISHSVTAPSASTTYTASFNTQYQLTTQASPPPGGSVTPASGQYFASGATIPVTATANTNFQFNNWTSTGGSFDSTTSASTNFHMPAAATTVTGNFIPASVQITITTNPANLLVSVDGGTFTAAPLVESWMIGSPHVITTTSPQSGGAGIQYAFSSWSDGGAISHGVIVPSTPTTYTASFATQYQLTTAVNPIVGGSVTPPSGNYYTSGTVVPLTATANPGFSFTNWTGNVASSTSASTSITMTAPQSVTANFSLIVVGAPTSTSVSSNNNPSFTQAPGNSVTFTATVTSNTTVNEGTITFSDPANDFTCSGGNTVPVSNGQASCTTSFTTEGSRVVTAAYNGTVNFQGSSGMITQTVNNHTVVTGNQFCNQGPITVPSTAGAATPYPSNIFVTGLSGNVGVVTVNLNNISSADIAQTDLLLVGPTGAAIIPFAKVGDGTTIGGVNITLDDAASSLIPGGSPLTSGTYKPTSITGSQSLVFPAPAPTVNGSNYAATDGTATLSSMFSGTAPNGTWALYAIDNSGSGAATIGGGWCVNISPATVAVTITTSPSGLLVSADGSTATAAPLVENWVPGSSHTIATSSPQSGAAGVQYVWSSWSDSGAISHGITVPSTATTYTASFNTQYQLTTQASPSADGTVTPATGGYFASGATIPVTATANSGFTFSNWTSTGGSFDSTTAASTNFHMPAAPATVTGNFGNASVQITITTSPANLLVSVDGGTSTAAPLVENWVIGSSHTIATTSPQSGGAGVQYVWSNWSDSGAISHSITVPPSPTTYTASFNTQYQLTTQASPSADGTVTPASGSYFASGATIPVTATAKAGFTFSNWTSTGGTFDSTTAASTNFHMPAAPATVTGNFTTAAQPQVTLNPTSVNFGNVYLNTMVSQEITVQNTGNAPLIFTSITLTGKNGGGMFRVQNSCPKTLAVGHTCDVVVYFTASQIGPRTNTLSFFDNAPGSPQQVGFTATVINPVASFNPTPVNFGTVKQGHSKKINVTITNTGTTQLTINSISITGADMGDFGQVNNCTSLAPNHACSVAVTFTPTTTGSRSADLTVMDNAQTGTTNIPLTGNGD